MKDIKNLNNKTGLSVEQRELLTYLLAEEEIELNQTSKISPREKPDEAPLSFAQIRLWLLDQLQPGSPTYNIPAAIRIQGRLNTAALEQSLNKIVQRHEALRTKFMSLDEQPIQVILSALTLTVPVIDLREFPESTREAQTLRLAAQEAQQPFDLIQGPLLRAKLLCLSQEEHILLLTMHHIVSDGWSIGVLVRELAALYDAISNSRSVSLPPLSIQYADFALWQRQRLQGEVLEALLAYWKQQLEGSLPILQLPTDRPRPTVQTFRGARQAFQLSEFLVEAISNLSQQQGTTLFITLLTAFKILLYRYTGQEDMLVGSPVANRNQTQTEDLIGFFINTLVLRTDLGGNPTFRELLDRVRKAVLGAYNHQDLPFEKLVETLRPERDLSHMPLFQVMFALQNAPMAALEFSGLKLSPLEIDNGTAKFELTLDLEETPNGIRGWFEYNTDLFDVATIARMTSHFQTLLESIVADPDQPIATLPMLTPTELHQLLFEWNHTQRDYPKDVCIHQLFEAQVERTPDSIAVVFGDEQLNYRELNQRANCLVHHLQKLGVTNDVLVGIYMERSLEMVVAILGILKVGGAYVPLDPGYPQERLAFMLEDAQVPVLLTQKNLHLRLPEQKVKIVCLDADWEFISQESQANPMSRVTAQNLAYVIYTSGSTGTPKGVMISHQAICNHMFWMLESFPLTKADKILQKTPFSFDASVWEFYAPLLAGAQLIIAQPGGHQDSAYLVNAIAKHQVTTIQLVPSLLRILLEEKNFENCHCLKRVFCGGEVLPVKLQQSFYEKNLNARLYNLYGPTEACIDATFWTGKRNSQQQVIPIGRPVANIQIYLLNSHLQPVQIGVPGELYIGGAGLARGYLNRSDLTAERFIPNPFSHEPEERLYKTGDLARYLPDGNIEYIGRLDHQVKIRGFRIELGEIEAVLAQHPALREVAVIGDQRLVAYVVSDPEQQSPTVSELRSFLKERLPDYMVPSAFVFLEALPLTPNGKINRHQLPVPDNTRPELARTFVAPRNSVEETLAQIWAEILEVKQVSIDDNFFELGGHSLLATQLISRIRKTFQVELPLRSLFESATIASLALQILDKQVEQADSEKLLNMLAEVEKLSNDEAQKILATER